MFYLHKELYSKAQSNLYYHLTLGPSVECAKLGYDQITIAATTKAQKQTHKEVDRLSVTELFTPRNIPAVVCFQYEA